jgi:ribosomal protein S18 acetylase RimI-like enzyme
MKYNVEIKLKDQYYRGECYINSDNGEYIINALKVKAMYKKMGIGTSLMKDAENFIKENLKGNIAILYVKDGTWQAEWYQRLGYQISSIQDGGEGYIRMEKNLK